MHQPVAGWWPASTCVVLREPERENTGRPFWLVGSQDPQASCKVALLAMVLGKRAKMRMEVSLESIASRKLEWLAKRQAAAAGNVANANTPAYKTKDITPFSVVLEKTELELASTNAAHLPIFEHNIIGNLKDASDTWEVTESGNSVGLENEMIKAASINQDYKLVTNIMKAFDDMFSSAVKA